MDKYSQEYQVTLDDIDLFRYRLKPLSAIG